MSDQIKRGTLCSLDSLEADEVMYGTATKVDMWFILEYNGRWSGEAFRDSKIPETVKTRINNYLETFPASRLQLIKKPRHGRSGIKFFIALSREKDPVIREFTINKYEDLLLLDIDSILKDGSSERKEPIFLICTNGEHDKCCGKFGMPVYLDIAGGVHGADTWQSTHLGGHRFASTLVCLPDGLYYGRVRDGKRADEIFGEYKNGKVDLRSYRGRSCYSRDVQAAEYFLRKETGIREIRAFLLRETRVLDNGLYVDFISPTGEKTYRVKMRSLSNAIKTLTSCGDKERSFIQQFRLLNIAALQKEKS